MVVAQAVATATERQSSRCLSCSGLLAVAIAPFWFYFTCVDALGLGFNVRQPCPLSLPRLLGPPAGPRCPARSLARPASILTRARAVRTRPT